MEQANKQVSKSVQDMLLPVSAIFTTNCLKRYHNMITLFLSWRRRFMGK